MLARSCLILALGLGVLAGCGDDENDDGAPTGQPDPTGSGNVPGSGIDGGAGIDAATGSSDAGSASDGGLTLLDGRVLGGSDGGCDIADPELGCGKANGSIVAFDNGLEIDRATGLAWAPAQAPSGSHGESAWSHCQELTLGGVDEFDLPTIDQVRTLAAGCAATVTGGTCTIAHERCVGTECGTDATTCKTCEVGKGPHKSGGYCRPELAECVTAWALTACDDNGLTDTCPVHQHWYYDVTNGGFGLSTPDSQLSGRCVARFAAPSAPPSTPPTTVPPVAPAPSTAPPPVAVPAP